MANVNQLRDLYAFPGFRPEAHVHGVFGDPYAVVIPLERLRKKPPVECVEPSTARSTINSFAAFAISTAAGVASIWSSPFAASPVGSARP